MKQNSQSVHTSAYPEARYGGFTAVDGTVAFYSRINALITEQSHVLDVGCGRGSFVEDLCTYRRALRTLKGKARFVTGLDVDSTAQEHPFLDQFLLITPGKPWPVDSATADLVVADYVCEHIPEPRMFLAEVVRVLKPGGYFCARTPNKLAYPALISSLIPNRMHHRVLAKIQPNRNELDIFPTCYRMNTRRTLRRLLTQCGLDFAITSVEAEPSYLAFSPFIYRVAARIHRWIPSAFQANLLVFARRKTECGQEETGVRGAERSQE